MNIAFTIVAKNYFSFAITLADSLKKTDPDLPFYIFLADEEAGLPEKYRSAYSVVPVNSLGIPVYKEMAFKYDVTEFNTAVKPFVIDHLFTTTNAGKVIYLDPDIFVYRSLTTIYDMLEQSSVVLTPHFLGMEEIYTGSNPEKEILFSGIFNLGFIALRRSDRVKLFVNWWKNRLAEYCYGDRMESLHVDQKWIDFLPALFTQKELLISRHPGLNIAYWNIHERMIENDGLKVVLKDEPGNMSDIIFLHFSGLNPLDPGRNKQAPGVNVNDYPQWRQLIDAYAAHVLRNDFEELFKLKYAYNAFDTGDPVLPFHRRVFRRLLELERKNIFDTPHAAGEGSFYALLKKNRLIAGSGVSIETKISKENIDGSVKRMKQINFLLKFLLRMVGLKNYITLLRFCHKYFRPENQVFLLQEYRKIAEELYFKVR